VVPDRGAAWPGQVVVGGQAKAAHLAFPSLSISISPVLPFLSTGDKP
jgi:hypothetical protein